MKRMMLTTLVLFWAALSLLAQEGLHVAPFYDGRFNKAKDVVSLNVKGSALKPYRLTLYRSLIFERDMPDVERAVLLDGKQAIDREVAHRDGRLLYGFYCLPQTSKKDPLRYLFYRHTAGKTILVYLEGEATLEEIKRMFKK